MESLLGEAAGFVALLIQAVAVLVVAVGALEALIAISRVAVRGRTADAEGRAVWLSFARWLVAGLTFQLAADIVQTTVAPSWDEIGRLAAIAAIRTFLTYFLDRDMDAIRERQPRSEPGASDGKHA